jgi:hypothetical protein
MAGLRLDTAAGIEQAAKGKLLKAVSYTDLNLRMPPPGKLPDQAIADFRKWVDMGAPHTLGETAPVASKSIDWERARRFWAFQPLRMVKAESIDQLLSSIRAEMRLTAAPPADPRTWLRRVTFDLTGLPPTPREIAGFLSDTTPAARQTVVDRLLASPHYGERWARHWLDLVRFAETNGHEFDNDKLDAWQYRDYVIRAFNQDVPYNTFVREHIAGDLLPTPRLAPGGAQLESPVGTGFYWFGEVLNSATDSVKSRADTVDNQIDVLSKAFLGLTTACARCHDHKFDPIPTVDYYALAGILHSTQMREAVIDSPERERQIREAIAGIPMPDVEGGRFELREGDILFEDFDTFEGWFVSGQAYGPASNGGVAGPRVNELVGSLTSRIFKMPKLWVHVRLAGTAQPKGKLEETPARLTLVADDHKSQHFFPDDASQKGWRWRTIRMTKEIGRECYFELVDRDRKGHLAIDAIIFSDHKEPPEISEEGRWSEPPMAARYVPESAWGMMARDDAPGNVRLHIRGNHKNLGGEVPRGFLKIIAGAAQPPINAGSGRLVLADWIASDRNPLTARVIVNRIWQHHFGQGLVPTVDNFGLTGDRPSNPELLDWLTRKFLDSNWSVKALHRLILLSEAYAMSNEVTQDNNRIDPGNKYLHHFPVRRLEAEAIRDAMLAVSGEWNRMLYGPSVAPHVSKYQDGRGKPVSGPLDGESRRSIYVQVRRNFLTPMFLAFDYPLPVSAAGNRGSSTVPSQALLMLNNEFVVESARRWAKELERAGEPEARLEQAYLAAFGRPPEESEVRELLAFAASRADAWADICHVLLNSAEFIYVR